MRIGRFDFAGRLPGRRSIEPQNLVQPILFRPMLFRLLVAECFDRVELGGAAGGVDAR